MRALGKFFVLGNYHIRVFYFNMIPDLLFSPYWRHGGTNDAQFGLHFDGKTKKACLSVHLSTPFCVCPFVLLFFVRYSNQVNLPVAIPRATFSLDIHPPVLVLSLSGFSYSLAFQHEISFFSDFVRKNRRSLSLRCAVALLMYYMLSRCEPCRW